MADLNFPTSPANNDTYEANGLTYTYSEVKDVWNQISETIGASKMTTSDTAPSSPNDGDLWWDTEEAKMYIYYHDGSSGQWVEANPDGIGYTGSIGIGYTGSAGAAGSFATVAQANTGTSADTVISPDVLAECVHGTKSVQLIVVDSTTSVAATDDQVSFTIPSNMNNMVLTRAQAINRVAGNTGSTTVDIYNVTDTADMLSGAISIADDATVGTPGTIVSSSANVVATDDIIRVDVTTIHSNIAPQGLIVNLEFRLP